MKIKFTPQVACVEKHRCRTRVPVHEDQRERLPVCCHCIAGNRAAAPRIWVAERTGGSKGWNLSIDYPKPESFKQFFHTYLKNDSIDRINQRNNMYIFRNE